MSATHSPTPPLSNDSSATPQPPSPPQKLTRTVAIIKHHALTHRFDIEPRIQEASFEIVKERQMEFDVETDPETLYELFGEDAESLGEGPVWVYVLERRRAVEVWNALMGDSDPEVARQESPNSLRALYGTSRKQNALMGSPDSETAEIQIASLFASSPPFLTSDLPDERFSTLNSVSSSVLSALQKASNEEASSSGVTSSSVGGSSKSPNGKPGFRARSLPATHSKPDIVPRTTSAAALRAGATPEKQAPRTPRTKQDLAKTFENVPGHKRAGTISVASTAAPTIAPRMTKAAALRLKIQPPPTNTRKTSTDAAENAQKRGFEGVPGHKRRETISVASVSAPTIAPRLNKSATLRSQKDSAPPSSFMFKGPTAAKVPGGFSRSNSQNSFHSDPKPPSRPASQASMQQNSRPATATLSRRPSTARPASATRINSSTSITSNTIKSSSTTEDRESPAPAKAEEKPRPRPRPSSIGAPTITPRTNKSAALRAAKKEQEAAAAAAAAAAKKNARMSRGPPPSSMPKSLVV